MEPDTGYSGGDFPTPIDGRTFDIGTEPEYVEDTDQRSGRWYAWCFFAYDAATNIYPADAIPAGVPAQESIAGEHGDTEAQARQRVEEKLCSVIRTRDLSGTGLYGPPAGRVYPQEFIRPADLPSGHITDDAMGDVESE